MSTARLAACIYAAYPTFYQLVTWRRCSRRCKFEKVVVGLATVLIAKATPEIADEIIRVAFYGISSQRRQHPFHWDFELDAQQHSLRHRTWLNFFSSRWHGNRLCVKASVWRHRMMAEAIDRSSHNWIAPHCAYVRAAVEPVGQRAFIDPFIHSFIHSSSQSVSQSTICAVGSTVDRRCTWTAMRFFGSSAAVSVQSS